MTRDTRGLSLLWATPESAAELARLHATLFEDAWSMESFQTLLADPGSMALQARLSDTPDIVGFLLARLIVDEVEILTLGVAADRQRHGIGRALVAGVARAALRAEAVRVHLEVAADNAAALALYGSQEFREINRRRGYYARRSGPPVDAVMMARELR